MMIDCQAVADKIYADTIERRQKFTKKPVLATLVVGDDPATNIYMRNKNKACEMCGIEVQEYRFPSVCTTFDIASKIYLLNGDSNVDGILLQQPLPSHIDVTYLTDLIAPSKDVDGLHSDNISALYRNKPKLIPCTPLGVMKILEHIGFDPTGKDVLIYGRSQIVGKPMAQLLTNANATVTLAHSQSDYQFIWNYDLVVTAVPIPHFINKGQLAENKEQVLIDCGIIRENGKVVGNIDPVERGNIQQTPVPKGVGLTTVACLCSNVISAMELK